MKQNFFRNGIVVMCGAMLISSAAIAQPKTSGIVMKRLSIPTMAKYSQLMRGIVGRSPSTAPREIASAQNSSGTAKLLIGATADRKATATAPAAQSTSGTVVCQSRPFALDFTTVGSFDVFRLDESKIYPGAIVASNSVLNAGFADVQNLPTRKPITLSVDLVASSGAADVVSVPLPLTNGTINSKVKDLIRTHTGATIPTQAAATAQSFTASAEITAELTSSAGAFVPLAELGIPGSATLENSGGASGSASSSVERYTVSLFEPMYTVAVGESGGGLFQDPNAVNNVEGVMINSVTYGRLLFIYIEGIGGSAKLKAFFERQLGIELVIEGSPVGVDVEQSGSVSSSAEFEITNMKATIIGGASAQGNALTSAILTGTNAKQKLAAYINARSAQTLSLASAAKPIAYTMVYVKNNAAMGVSFRTESQILFGCRAARKLRVEMVSMKATRVVDNPAGAGGDNDDYFGEIKAKINPNHVLAGDASKKLFDFSRSAPLRLKQGQSSSINKAMEATIDPNSLESFSVGFEETVADEFDDGERFVNPGKTSAAFEFNGNHSFSAADLNLLRSSGAVTKLIKLQESGGESACEATIRFAFVD